MSERRDDTTKNGEQSPEQEQWPESGSYYYDDSTGYEVFNPAAEEDEDPKNADESKKPDP
jgi:hypothetical protein